MRVSIRPDPLALTGNGSTYILIAAWIYANIRSLKWLFESLRQASPLNLSLIGFIVVVLLVQVVRSRRRAGFEIRDYLCATPVLRSHPLLLMVGSALSAIALQWLVDIEQLTILLFLLGTYGLCGLFLAPSIWRKGLPLASIVACLISFSSQLGVGLGLPARILTAHAVEHLLSSWHIAAISSYDIIVLENGVAQVDVPCSGLKSLGTGTLFLLAATWMEGRKLGVRWLLVCASNLFLLVCANIIRVLLLVVITYVLKQPLFAEILHIPLGLIGLACACGLSWMMLQTVPKQGEVKDAGTRGRGDAENFSTSSPASLAAQAFLIAFVIALIPINQLYHPQQEQPRSLASLHLPEQIMSESIPLSAAEQTFFDNYPSIVPEKRRFVSGDLSGSILMVANTTWRTYHPPELCLLASGLKVNRMEKKSLTPAVQARWLSLADGKYSAAYWFQSPKQTTDDFLSRLWSDVTRRQKNWVLISVLFDRSLSPDSTEIRNFTTTIHDAIDQSLSY
jgi:exosortase O